MAYQPPAEILEKYADVLVNFALNSGEGVKPGEVVLVQVPECAKPLYVPLRNAVLRAQAYPMMQLLADGVSEAEFYATATNQQLKFFPDRYYRGLADQIDHRVRIIAEADKYELAGVDPKRIVLHQNSFHRFREWLDEKEAAGKFTWTLALYGTPAMAADVKLTEEEYWDEIIKACYLDEADPKATWKNTFVEMERIRHALNALKVKTVKVVGEGIDLQVGIGPNREWLGGSGRNIPSFELFISPDWRLTEGEVHFNQPLYRYGSVIEGISLRFKGGRVVEATAAKNEQLLKEMIASENGDKIGEFSLTDRRFSRITKLMGETLYDENIGGDEGNTHLAVGNAYKDSYPGDESTVTKEQWQDWGYNESPVHCDIISTAPRVVTATLEDGSSQVIYKNGMFTL